jgi:hypothetical protein
MTLASRNTILFSHTFTVQFFIALTRVKLYFRAIAGKLSVLQQMLRTLSYSEHLGVRTRNCGNRFRMMNHRYCFTGVDLLKKTRVDLYGFLED